MNRSFIRITSSCFCAGLILHSTASAQWVDFVDETDTRISGDPQVTTADIEEKDIAIADLDLDGDLDVVVVRKRPFGTAGVRRNVLLINENGVLVERTDLAPSLLEEDDSRDVALVDVDLDGWCDIVVANSYSCVPRLHHNLGVDESGQFLGFTGISNWYSPEFDPPPNFCGLAVGDINADGFPDLYFTDYSNELEDCLLVNDQSGLYIDETSTRVGNGLEQSGFGTGVIMDDFNLDGSDDVVKVSTLSDPLALRFMINNGNGVLGFFQDLPYDQVYMIASADFDNNGRPDLYVESDNQDYVLFNEGTNQPFGTLDVVQVDVEASRTASNGGNTHPADLDRDGFVDAGVADTDIHAGGCDRQFVILRNKLGQGEPRGLADPYEGVTMPWHLNGVHDFAWIDLNADGFLDLLIGNCEGLRVFTMKPFAAVELFGSGVPGGQGELEISVSAAPVLGTADLQITVHNAAPGELALLLMSPTTSSGTPPLLVGPPFVLVVPTRVNDQGEASFGGAVPGDVGFEGTRLFSQWFVQDPAGEFLGTWSVSPGLELYFSATTLP